MDRGISVLVALGLIIAACGGGETADSSSVTTSSSTTTTVATTTTTEGGVEACVPTPLEGRPRAWEEGCIYSATEFVVPLTFEPHGPGWSSTGAASRWVSLRYDADSDSFFDMTLTLLAFEADLPPGEVIDALLAIEGVAAVSDRIETTVANYPAITIDVLGESEGNVIDDNVCSRPYGSAQFFTGVPGYPLFRDPDMSGPSSFGVPACFSTRVWVIDSSSTSVTALVVVEDESLFEGLAEVAADLLDNHVAFGDSDG